MPLTAIDTRKMPRTRPTTAPVPAAFELPGGAVCGTTIGASTVSAAVGAAAAGAAG